MLQVFVCMLKMVPPRRGVGGKKWLDAPRVSINWLGFVHIIIIVNIERRQRRYTVAFGSYFVR